MFASVDVVDDDDDDASAIGLQNNTTIQQATS